MNKKWFGLWLAVFVSANVVFALKDTSTLETVLVGVPMLVSVIAMMLVVGEGLSE